MTNCVRAEPKKLSTTKKSGCKITYPPPADGLFVTKKCKHQAYCNWATSPGPLRVLAA